MSPWLQQMTMGLTMEGHSLIKPFHFLTLALKSNVTATSTDDHGTHNGRSQSYQTFPLSDPCTQEMCVQSNNFNIATPLYILQTLRHRRTSLINIMYQAHGAVIDLPSMVICKLSTFLPNTVFSCQRPMKTQYTNVIFLCSKAHLELMFLCQDFPAQMRVCTKMAEKKIVRFFITANTKPGVIPVYQSRYK